MIRKAPSNKPGFVLVTFELPATIWAERVSLAGEFNDWQPDNLFLVQHRDSSIWHITLELQCGREYQFRYLVNGLDWHNDWHADRYAPNSQGSDNSVVVT